MLELAPAALAAALLLSVPATASESAANESFPRQGQLLYGELGCAACHRLPTELVPRVLPRKAPRLADVGARLEPAWMRRWLDDPQATMPGATMPDVLHGLEGDERDETIEALVHFLASQGGERDEAPVFAGSPIVVEPGRELFHRVGCVACHEPIEKPWHLEVPWHELDQWVFEDDEDPPEDPFVPDGVLDPKAQPLGDLAAKWTVASLTEFLLDPLAVRPSGRMPSLRLAEDEARSIALYLLRDQGFGADRVPEPAAGLAYAYYEGNFSDPPAFDEQAPVRRGSVASLDGLPEHRGDAFGFRFTCELEVPEDGEYTFWTWSDDGSRLYVDGEWVVNNDGTHPPTEETGTIELTAGAHAIEVTMYENGGGEELRAEWAGPGVERQPIGGDATRHRAYTYTPTGREPFEVDPDLAAAGAAMFDARGCANCHDDLGERRPDSSLANETRGCLADVPPEDAPWYSLDDGRRRALSDFLLRMDVLPAASPEEALGSALDAYSCLACHRREGLGGPHPVRKEYFHVEGDVELGDQGRIPPDLTRSGDKLRTDWMRAVMFEADGWRPYMATRMPQFGVENIGHVPELLVAVDRRDGPQEPPFTTERVEAGHALAGTSGLGCIQCHTFNGHDSLGVPAVDLAGMHDRLRWGWFRDLLRDPNSLDLNTRMPNFWVDGASPVADVLEGDVDAQVEALWTYLSLGASMPTPAGLVVSADEYELVPVDRAIQVGVFFQDASARTVLVGFPVATHYAFDVENSRLVLAWRGRFFDARGTWHGRAGQLEWPDSPSQVELPAGPTFAELEAPDAPWPTPTGRDAGFRPLGRRVDPEGTPSFRYAYAGWEIEEKPRPILAAGGGRLVREFRLTPGPDARPIWMRPGTDPDERVALDPATWSPELPLEIELEW